MNATAAAGNWTCQILRWDLFAFSPTLSAKFKKQKENKSCDQSQQWCGRPSLTRVQRRKRKILSHCLNPYMTIQMWSGPRYVFCTTIYPYASFSPPVNSLKMHKGDQPALPLSPTPHNALSSHMPSGFYMEMFIKIFHLSANDIVISFIIVFLDIRRWIGSLSWVCAFKKGSWNKSSDQWWQTSLPELH